MGLGDTVLERNVCFVDTPGLNEDHVAEGNCANYIESQLHRKATFSAFHDSEVLNLLGAGGGPQVDVVLYIFGHGTSLKD